MYVRELIKILITPGRKKRKEGKEMKKKKRQIYHAGINYVRTYGVHMYVYEEQKPLN